eukprot:TRINITY_DN23298_c0_g1_i5.p1 TRINITY_DN23298_c0_g1~~TRINITY_DN23298_c0_g1_i5.p1  ORF type:complete len:295 (-),score=33.27 TRINITY_DN23298_c0_g1_i5:269-1120(-)
MFVLFLFVSLVCAFVQAQFSQASGYLCDDDMTMDVFNEQFRNGREVNLTELEPLIQQATASFDSQLEGLSGEELFQKIPASVFQTMLLLVNAFPEQSTVAQFAVFEGFQRADNGTELLLETLKRPYTWSGVLGPGMRIFNFSCYSDDAFAIAANVLIYIEPLLQLQYRDELQDFLVGVTVDLVTYFQAAEDTIRVIDPIISTLEQTGDVSGILSTLLSLASQDVVATAFEESMKSADLDTDGSTWGNMMSIFFSLLQSIFDYDDDQFTQFMIEFMQDIVTELK